MTALAISSDGARPSEPTEREIDLEAARLFGICRHAFLAFESPKLRIPEHNDLRRDWPKVTDPVIRLVFPAMACEVLTGSIPRQLAILPTAAEIDREASLLWTVSRAALVRSAWSAPDHALQCAWHEIPHRELLVAWRAMGRDVTQRFERGDAHHRASAPEAP